MIMPLLITPITDTLITIAMAMMIEMATIITAAILLNDYAPGEAPVWAIFVNGVVT